MKKFWIIAICVSVFIYVEFYSYGTLVSTHSAVITGQARYRVDIAHPPTARLNTGESVAVNCGLVKLGDSVNLRKEKTKLLRRTVFRCVPDPDFDWGNKVL